jgi:hypothetical protein
MKGRAGIIVIALMDIVLKISPVVNMFRSRLKYLEIIRQRRAPAAPGVCRAGRRQRRAPAAVRFGGRRRPDSPDEGPGLRRGA